MVFVKGGGDAAVIMPRGSGKGASMLMWPGRKFGGACRAPAVGGGSELKGTFFVSTRQDDCAGRSFKKEGTGMGRSRS